MSMASQTGADTKKNSNISIPDIFVHKADDPEDLPEYVPLRHQRDIAGRDGYTRRHRRSGVVNSMEDINRLSGSSQVDDDMENEEENEASFMSPGCSNSSVTQSELETETETDDASGHDGVYDENSTSERDEDPGVRPKTREYTHERRLTPPIYDETKPRRKKKFEPSFDPKGHLQLNNDIQKAKRKVSFDTALDLPKHKGRGPARVEGQPVRKISLDSGLDDNNIRKVSFLSNPFDSPSSGRKQKGVERNMSHVESIGQISFDVESGTLQIRKLSQEEMNNALGMNLKSESNTDRLTVDDNIHPCDTPRKVSYAESENELGHINRGFQNDTYLDNVTFYVQKNVQEDADLKNGHLFDEPEEETTLSTPTKSKGILKGWKSTTEDKSLNDGKDTDQCQNSTLASHLRKDSIALTSEKLGQILDIQKHYKKLHKQKRFGKQREILKKYQLQIGVAALFIMTVVIVSIGWHFHAIHKHEKMISQRIFFEAEKRNLNLADPAKRDDIAGKLGLSLPVWQLPSHCNKDTEEDEYQCLKWKGNAEFRIWYYTRNEIQCYNISWQFLNTHMLPKDCYQIGNAAWYGPSNVSNPTWTNRGINFTFSSSFTHEYNAGDFSIATENYWLSSRGVGIFVPRNIPLVVDWNKSKRGWICLLSNYTGDFYGNKMTHAKHFLNYTICNGNDVKATHAYMRNLLPNPPIRLPDHSLLSDPLWSTTDPESGQIKITEKSIYQKVLHVKKYNLTCSSIVIDRTWQKWYGDFEFDSDRFPNITDLLNDIRNNSWCSILLTFNPYFEYRSKSFTEGHPDDAFIKDASGHVPGLMKWDHRVVAMLDVTNPSAVSWLKGKMNTLISKYSISSFFLEYSTPNWIPYHPTLKNGTVYPTAVRELFSKLVASFASADTLILHGTSNTQSMTAFVSIPTYVVRTESGRCLSGSLSSALTLGIMGYPFVMADGIFHSDDTNIPRDLYIRWLQLAALFPAMKYSTSPWIYDSEVVKIAQNMSLLHKKYVTDELENMKKEILSGSSIMRPIWWNDPLNSDALKIEDEFLIGDDILVAPILCEGVTSRKVYFPDGLWSFENGEKFIEGNSWIELPIRSHDIPIFIKKNVVGSLTISK